MSKLLWLVLAVSSGCATAVVDGEGDEGSLSQAVVANVETFEQKLVNRDGDVTDFCTLTVPAWDGGAVVLNHTTGGAKDYVDGFTFVPTGEASQAFRTGVGADRVLVACEGGALPCKLTVSLVSKNRAPGQLLGCSIEAELAEGLLVGSSVSPQARSTANPRTLFRQALINNGAGTDQKHTCFISLEGTTATYFHFYFRLHLDDAVVNKVDWEWADSTNTVWRASVPTGLGSRYGGVNGAYGQAMHVLPFGSGIAPGTRVSCDPAINSASGSVGFNAGLGTPHTLGTGISLELL